MRTHRPRLASAVVRLGLVVTVLVCVGVTTAATPPDTAATPRAQSALIGATAAATADLTGGRCATVKGLTACETGWAHLYARGGTTYGDTYISGADPTDISRRLIAHEKHHRDEQWRQHGVGFAARYLGAEVLDRWLRGHRCNRYEQTAEDVSDGAAGYDCPGHHREPGRASSL